MLQLDAGGLHHSGFKVKGCYIIFSEFVITKLTEEHSSMCDCWRAERLTDAPAGVGLYV